MDRFRNAERVSISPVGVYMDKTQQSLNGILIFDGFRTNGGYVNNGFKTRYSYGNMRYIPVIESKERIKPFKDYSKVVVDGEYGFYAYYGKDNNLIGLRAIEKIPEDICDRIMNTQDIEE